MSPERRVQLSRALILALGVGAVPVTVLAFRPESQSPGGSASVPLLHFPVPGDSSGSTSRAARRAAVLTHDPFRRSRTAPTQSYDAAKLILTQQQAAAPPPLKPALSLTGIMWGTRPEALLEGIPGQEGARLLRPGDTVGGIRLRSLSRTHAVLAGFDTVWSLVIREAVK